MQIATQAPTIMHVDDNGDHAFLFRLALQSDWPAAEIKHFSSGFEALGWLESNPGFHPDMILLDLCMPGMDGQEFLDALQAQPLWQRIPVAVLSTSKHPDDMIRAARRQVFGYFVKPHDPTAFTPACVKSGSA